MSAPVPSYNGDFQGNPISADIHCCTWRRFRHMHTHALLRDSGQPYLRLSPIVLISCRENDRRWLIPPPVPSSPSLSVAHASRWRAGPHMRSMRHGCGRAAGGAVPRRRRVGSRCVLGSPSRPPGPRGRLRSAAQTVVTQVRSHGPCVNMHALMVPIGAFSSCGCTCAPRSSVPSSMLVRLRNPL